MHGKKAIVVTVPFPQLRAFQRLHGKLTRELEKKYSGKVVVFIAKVMCPGGTGGTLHNLIICVYNSHEVL